jgi:hypothetical protein
MHVERSSFHCSVFCFLSFLWYRKDKILEILWENINKVSGSANLEDSTCHGSKKLIFLPDLPS